MCCQLRSGLCRSAASASRHLSMRSAFTFAASARRHALPRGLGVLLAFSSPLREAHPSETCARALRVAGASAPARVLALAKDVVQLPVREAIRVVGRHLREGCR